MLNLKIAPVAGLVALVTAASVSVAGACEIGARVNMIGNEFPAIQTVAATAQKCTGAEIGKNLTAEHKNIQVAGLSGNPAEYTAAIISNGTIVELLNEDLIRPLDDLVAKHGQSMRKSQLITIDGKVMAVAFMANAQHLVYRQDLLDKAGLSVPKSYEEVLAAAKVLRDKGILQNPVGGAYKAGWNLGQEFNNMFIGFGGTHFKPGSAEPNINSEAGLKALKMMKDLSAYMNPDFLTHDSNATNAEFRAGNVALMNMWGSRAATLPTAEGVPQAVIDGFAISGPLTVGGGTIPASTLWWDGWTISKNIPDAEAEASFIALAKGSSPAIFDDPEAQKQAVWMVDGYQPTAAADGVIRAIEMETTLFPTVPYMGLMHTILGNELSDFMRGKETAEQALMDAEAAYRAAAKEKGFL